MLNRHRLSYRALGRCLVVATLLGAGASEAQDGPEGITYDSQTQRAETATETGGGQQPATSPLILVLPVESRLQTKPPADKEEAKAQKRQEARDEADLKAQRAMADATEKIVGLTALQAFIALLGLLALYYTLRLQRKATNAAIKTLEVERRGYVGIKRFVFNRATWNTDTETGVKGFHIVPILENSGNAPVVIKKTIISTRVVYDGNISGIDWSDSMEHPESTVVMGPKATSPMREIVSNLYSLNKILKDELRVLHMFKIEYANFFDRKTTYHTNQCAELYVRGDPYEIFRNTERSPSAYLIMEMVGQYSSAS